MKETENSEAVDIAKASTGIVGLDSIMNGGFPENRTTLIKGSAGTGKTVMGMEFLYRSATRQEPGIFVSFEETTDALRNNARSIGWDIATQETAGDFFLWDAKIDRASMVSGDFTIDPLLAVIKGKAEQMGAKRIVIDAVDVLMRYFEDIAKERAELYRLHDWLIEQRFTTVLTAKLSMNSESDSHYEFLDYLADCVLLLDLRTVNQVSIRRLRVVKYRGSSFCSNEHPYIIRKGGNVVMPITAFPLRHQPPGKKISSGNSNFDQLLGGGFHQSSSVLVAGPTGSGKTTLAANFTQAACSQDKRMLYVSFEESPESIVNSMLSPGIDLRPALKKRQLEFHSIMPEAMVPEMHLYEILQKISHFQPDHLVVDAISACKRMAGQAAAFDFLVRLTNHCKEHSITCLMTNQLYSNQQALDISGIGLTSLIDTLTLIKLQETDECLERKLIIWKSRGTRHSNRYHSFLITDQGIRIENAKKRLL